MEATKDLVYVPRRIIMGNSYMKVPEKVCIELILMIMVSAKILFPRGELSIMAIVVGNGIGDIDEAFCTSFCANDLRKGMNQSTLQ